MEDALMEPYVPLTMLGKRIYYYKVTGSTNEDAKRLAEAGAEEGTIVIAEEQTAGKGRLGRRWLSPPGTSILMSVLFRPPLAPHRAQCLTMITSLAVAEAVEAMTPLRVHIKWPNDILIRGKKAGGILTELGIKGGSLDYAVVGLGLNVNVDFRDLKSPLIFLTSTATSLYNELGYRVPRTPLLLEILRRLEDKYIRLKEGEDFRPGWLKRLANLNQEVCVITPHEVIEGTAIDVNQDGALLVRTPTGEVRTVWAGDVTLKKDIRGGSYGFLEIC
ncbi:MAG TPA: biotin--[acetyl-CoA-carboxylase] ligase [Chloroflexi bacterium]|nr:biotin--[acetyl-CoA-carboxylase] ligase [Chloroflexota bacterium]